MAGLAFSPDGTKLYGLPAEDLEQWDVATRKRTGFTGFSLGARAVAFRRDGKTLVTAGDGRTIAMGREGAVDLCRRT
ncbi:hypothetical protein Q5762_33850 [Streptomyces sp. P9(2023)]|uniref:hypothetical protein n=1 Tax=Streptomyces sp. P9(2023) TaxID=3064394 RepID=UPI0028F41B9C|nr:hypothetical protein [Streptomyces sp. P9(2023)]MDT9693223.1 hypothetical protein [Streptomyces sp. P9(2023)]